MINLLAAAFGIVLCWACTLPARAASAGKIPIIGMEAAPPALAPGVLPPDAAAPLPAVEGLVPEVPSADSTPRADVPAAEALPADRAEGFVQSAGRAVDAIRGEGSFGAAVSGSGQSQPADKQAALGHGFDGLRARPPAADEDILEPATDADIPAIDAVVKASLLSEQPRDAAAQHANTGFVVDEGPEFYRMMLHHPHVRIAVVRHQGEIVAFGMFYTKEALTGEPRHELNRLVLKAIQDSYGPEANMMVIKHVIVSEKASGRGLAARLVARGAEIARERGIPFVFAPIANDELLRGTLLDFADTRLENVRSRRAFGKAPGVKLALERFVYSHEVERFLKDGFRPRLGIHNWQVWGFSQDPARPFPDVPVPQKNLPPSEAE